MGLSTTVQVKIALAAGNHLLDGTLGQLIFNVSVEPAPNAARIKFTTLHPAWATVELFRMVHGTLDLDMEPENLAGTGIELFGNARTAHDVPVFGLEQERRYWYRISVPRKSPVEPLATGHVRARGPLATTRQMLNIDIARIHLYDDSDTSSDGDLSFSSAVYDATVPAGQRLTPLGPVQKFTRGSGEDIDAPFTHFPTVIERAPEAIGVWVLGNDNDRGVPLPGQGFDGIGLQAPDRMPSKDEVGSSSGFDFATALKILQVRGDLSRHAQMFAFDSAHGALHFNVQGSYVAFGKETLSALPEPLWLGFLPHSIDIGGGGKIAGKLRLADGRLGLRLTEDGRLSRLRRGRRDDWVEVESPALTALRGRLIGGHLLLAGLDAEGRLHLASLSRPRDEQPNWQATELRWREAPWIFAGDEGDGHLLGRDIEGALRHAGLTRDGRAKLSAEPLAEGFEGKPVALVDGTGRLRVAISQDHRRLLLATVAGRRPSVIELDTPFTRPLALVDGEAEGVLLVAHDEHGEAAALAIDEPTATWQRLGPVDELLEGPLEGVAESEAGDADCLKP